MYSLQFAKWLLLSVVLLACGLRTWGINFGLPYLYHPDEPRYVTIVQNIFKTGDLNPHFFNYPSLFFYLNVIAYFPYYLIGKMMGMFVSRTDILAPILVGPGVGITPMPSTLLLGRSLAVVFGTGAIALLFLIGWRQSGKLGVGLLAALMMAVSPINVDNSRYIAPDTYLVFFVLLAFLGSVLIFQQGKAWQYLFAGLATGLVASTKYNGALIGISLVAGHFLRCGRIGFRDPKLYLAIAVGVAAFLFTTPFAALDIRKFWADFQYEVNHYSTGHPGFEHDTLNWYLTYLWQSEGIVALLALAGPIRNIYIRSNATLLVSVFPLTYFIFISSFVVRFNRILLPLTPFLFLLAADFLANLLDQGWDRASATGKLKFLAGVILTVTCVIIPLSRTIDNNLRLTTLDSRETAREWIDQNLSPGSRIVIEAYAPYVDPQRFSLRAVTRMIDNPVNWYAANGFDYLVFSQGIFGRYYLEPDIYATEIAQYDHLFRSFDLVKDFTDGGYNVRIYRVAK